MSNERDDNNNMRKCSRFTLVQVALIVVVAVVVALLLRELSLAWYVAYVQRMALAVAGLTFAAAIVGLMVFLFWGRILRSLGLPENHGASEIAQSISRILSKISQVELGNEGLVLSKSLLAWYAWGKTWTTVIGVIFGLLAVLGGFVGSTLIVKQNELIERQNSLLAEQENVLEEQTGLMKRQTEATDLEITLLRDQNSIAEATRLASFNSELSAIQSAIHSETGTLGNPPDPAATPSDTGGEPAIATKPRWTIDYDGGLPQGYPFALVFPHLTPDTLESTFLLPAPSTVARPHLSEALIGRIVAFSRSISPYRQSKDSDDLGTSLEKHQLFMALSLSGISMRPFEGSLDLTFADFHDRDLDRARFDGMRLHGAVFDEAVLTGASFCGVDLTTVSFKNCEMAGAMLWTAALPDVTQLEGSKVDVFSLAGAYTDNPKWLEQAVAAGVVERVILQVPDSRGANQDIATLVQRASTMSASGTRHVTSRIPSIVGAQTRKYRLDLVPIEPATSE